MKTLILAASFLGLLAAANVRAGELPAPGKVELVSSFHDQRGSYSVEGALLLHKESDKKVDYRGVVSVQNTNLPQDTRTYDAQLVIKKSKNKFVGSLAWESSYLNVVSFELPVLVPGSGQEIQSVFTEQRYDPGPPGDPIGGIWWPIVRHLTTLTITY